MLAVLVIVFKSNLIALLRLGIVTNLDINFVNEKMN